jgi:type III pantothenate kinase
MLLAVDVGNTQTVVGLFTKAIAGEASVSGPGGAAVGLVHSWRVKTDSERTADELALLFNQLLALESLELSEAVTGLAVASVVPRLRAALREMAERWVRVPTLIVEPGVRTGMPLLYENPREVGADRIADAVAAYDLFGGPTIVIDFGTATTYEAVSAQGEYLGGAVIPGLEISLDALYGRAAALGRVELIEPRNVIGKSTVEAIQSGAVFGVVAQVDGMCARMEVELGPCTVVATGGLSGLISPLTKRIDHHEPWLTLHGLRLLYERNRS